MLNSMKKSFLILISFALVNSVSLNAFAIDDNQWQIMEQIKTQRCQEDSGAYADCWKYIG